MTIQPSRHSSAKIFPPKKYFLRVTPSIPTNIQIWVGFYMPIRKNGRRCSYRILIVSVFLLCGLMVGSMVRYTPPSFVRSSPSHSVRSQANPTYRFWVDNEAPQWLAPGSATTLVLPTTSITHLYQAEQSFLLNISAGCRYNRPPPLA